MYAHLNENGEPKTWMNVPPVGQRWVEQPVFDEEGNQTGTERVRVAVSNFHLLPNEILKEEGWLPVEEDESAIAEGQVRDGFTYTVEEDRVVRHWAGVTPPEPTPPPDPAVAEAARERIAQLRDKGIPALTPLERNELLENLTTLLVPEETT